MSKLVFKYGAMGSGKSAVLLQLVHNYETNNVKVILMKPKLDTKGDKKIVSRIGLKRSADVLIDGQSDLFKICENYSVIVVDEAQFLSEKNVDDLYKLAKLKNKMVFCYGLRTDFQMKAFPGSRRLLEIADKIEELKTICKCGKNKATQNMRFVNNVPVFDGNQIEIDNQYDVRYEAVCGKCYLKERMKRVKK